jgi:uncharacterized protein YjbI with pentapeptide repeats
MANEEHLAKLREGVAAWNSWRKEKPGVKPDLRYADLHGMELDGADLSGSNLCRANLVNVSLREADVRESLLAEADLTQSDLQEADLSWSDFHQTKLVAANLTEADLRVANLLGADLNEADLSKAMLYKANLSGANLNGASLWEANLSGANLKGATLNGANLSEANLNGADLSGALIQGSNLLHSMLVRTNLQNADLTGCSVYGLSAWDLQLDGAIQSDLKITPPGAAAITVDSLEVAQFIYLLLNNERIRNVVDTITSKVVLILGRFTPERKAILDAIRDALRKRNYLPVLFDFEKPASRDLTETVSTLAHMARFVIADITDAKSIPQELERIVPDLPSVPVQPLLLASQHEYAMFEHFRRYPWVLEPVIYESEVELLGYLDRKVIAPAEAKAQEQKPPK